MSKKNTITKRGAAFTAVPNALLNDARISLSAKGVYAFMRSKPANWNFTLRSMAKQLKEGETAISSALKDLKDYGWVLYIKHSDGRGEYILEWDEPKQENPVKADTPEIEHPKQENPNQENPVKAEPEQENPNQGYPMKGKPQRISNKEPIVIKINNKDICSSEQQHTETLPVKNKRFTKPSAIEVAQYFFESTDWSTADCADLAQRFVNHYEANGWMVGRTAMKNWQAACRTWITNQGKYAGNSKQAASTANQDAFIEKHTDRSWADGN